MNEKLKRKLVRTGSQPRTHASNLVVALSKTQLEVPIFIFSRIDDDCAVPTPASHSDVSQGVGFSYVEVFTCFFGENSIGQKRSSYSPE